jgi:hypothetical protein
MRMEFFKDLAEKYGGTEKIRVVEYSGTEYTEVTDTFLMFDGVFGYVVFWLDLAKEAGLASLEYFREWDDIVIRQHIIKLATMTKEEFEA